MKVYFYRIWGRRKYAALSYPWLRTLKRETCLCLHSELSHQPRHPLQQPQTTHDATFNSLGVGHKQMQVKGGGIEWEGVVGGRWVFVLWRGLSTLTSAPDQLQLMCPRYFMAPPTHLYTHTDTPIEIYIFLSHILGTSFGCYLTTWFLLRWIVQRLLVDLASSWGGSQQHFLAHIRFAEQKEER